MTAEMTRSVVFTGDTGASSGRKTKPGSGANTALTPEKTAETRGSAKCGTGAFCVAEASDGAGEKGVSAYKI